MRAIYEHITPNWTSNYVCRRISGMGESVNGSNATLVQYCVNNLLFGNAMNVPNFMLI